MLSSANLTWPTTPIDSSSRISVKESLYLSSKELYHICDDAVVGRSGGTIIILKPSTLEQQNILFSKDESLDAFSTYVLPASDVESMANLLAPLISKDSSQPSTTNGSLGDSPTLTDLNSQGGNRLGLDVSAGSPSHTPIMTPISSTGGPSSVKNSSSNSGIWTFESTSQANELKPVVVKSDVAHIYCATHGLETRVHVFGYPSRRKLFSFTVPAVAIASLQVSRDGNFLVILTAGSSSRIMLYKLCHTQLAQTSLDALSSVATGYSVLKSPSHQSGNLSKIPTTKEIMPKLMASASLPVAEQSPLDEAMKNVKLESGANTRTIPVSSGHAANADNFDLKSKQNKALADALKEIPLPVQLKGSQAKVSINPFNASQIVTYFRSRITIWIVGPGSATTHPPALMPIDISFPSIALNPKPMDTYSIVDASSALRKDSNGEAFNKKDLQPPVIVVAVKWVADSRFVFTLSNGALFAVGVPSLVLPRAFETTSNGTLTEDGFFKGSYSQLRSSTSSVSSSTISSNLPSMFFSTEELSILRPILSPIRKKIEARFVRFIPCDHSHVVTDNESSSSILSNTSYSEGTMEALNLNVRLTSLDLCHRYLLVGAENDTVFWLDVQTFETVFVQRLSKPGKLAEPLLCSRSPAKSLMSRSYGKSIVSISFSPHCREFIALSACGVLRRVVFSLGPASDIRLLSIASKVIRDAYVHHTYALAHSKFVELAAIGQDAFQLPSPPNVGEVEANILRLRNCRFPTLDEDKLLAIAQRLSQEQQALQMASHGGSLDAVGMAPIRPTLSIDIIMGCAEPVNEEVEAAKLKASLFVDTTIAIFPLVNDPAFSLFCELPDVTRIVPLPCPPLGSPAAIRLERDLTKLSVSSNNALSNRVPVLTDGLDQLNADGDLSEHESSSIAPAPSSDFASLQNTGVSHSKARASTSTALVWSTMGPISTWSYSPRYLLDSFQLTDPKTAVAVSKDGTFAVVGSACGSTHVLNISDVTSIKLVWSQRYHSSAITAISFNRDGDMFSVTSLDQTLFIRTSDLNVLGYFEHTDVLNFVSPSYSARTLAGLHTLVSALYRSSTPALTMETSIDESLGLLSNDTTTLKSKIGADQKPSPPLYGVPKALEKSPMSFAEAIGCYVLGMYSYDDIELRISKSIDASLARMKSLRDTESSLKENSLQKFEREQVVSVEWAWGFAENEVTPERFLISTTKGRVITIRPPNPFFQTSSVDNRLSLQSLRPVATVIQCAATAMTMVPHSISVHLPSASQLLEPIKFDSGHQAELVGMGSSLLLPGGNIPSAQEQVQVDSLPAFVVLAGVDRIVRVFEVLSDGRLVFCSSCATAFGSPIKSISFAPFSQAYSMLSLLTVTCCDGSITLCSLLPGGGLSWIQPANPAQITPATTPFAGSNLTSPTHSTSNTGRKGNQSNQAGVLKGNIPLATPSSVVGGVPRIKLADPSDIVEEILEIVVAAANRATVFTELSYEPGKEARLGYDAILLKTVSAFARGGSVNAKSSQVVTQQMNSTLIDDDATARDLLRGQCAAHALAVYVALARVALAALTTSVEADVSVNSGIASPAELVSEGESELKSSASAPLSLLPTLKGISSAAANKLATLQQSFSETRASASAAAATVIASVPGLNSSSQNRQSQPAKPTRQPLTPSSLSLDLVGQTDKGIAVAGLSLFSSPHGHGDPTKDLLQSYLACISNSPSGGVGYLINDRATNSAMIRPFALVSPHTYSRVGPTTAAFGVGGFPTNLATGESISQYAGAEDVNTLLTSGPDGAILTWDLTPLLQLPLYLLHEAHGALRVKSYVQKSARVAYASRPPIAVKPAMLEALAAAAAASSQSKAAVATPSSTINTISVPAIGLSEGNTITASSQCLTKEASFGNAILHEKREYSDSSSRQSKRNSSSRANTSASLDSQDQQSSFLASARFAHNTGHLLPREELRKALDTFRRTFESLMKANDAASPLERVDITEFAVDTELAEALRRKADTQVEATRKAISRDILASQLMAHRIRKECIESMEAAGRVVIPVTESAIAEEIECHSFPIKKLSDTEKLRGRRIEFLRRMEILDERLRQAAVQVSATDGDSSTVVTKTETSIQLLASDSSCILNSSPSSMRLPWDTSSHLIGQILKDVVPGSQHGNNPAQGTVNNAAATNSAAQPDNEKSGAQSNAGISFVGGSAVPLSQVATRSKRPEGFVRPNLIEMHYHPLMLSSEVQKRVQLHLTTQQILAFKREFNTVLDELAQQKQICIEIVADRMKRIIKIREELGITGPSELISLDLRERDDTIFVVQDHEVKTEKYLSKRERELKAKREAEEAARKLLDSGPERALFEMMGGNPEASKQREILSMDIVREAWMDEIPEDQMSEQQQADYAAYLKKVKRFNEEQERRRKLLTTELAKLTMEIADRKKGFDEQVKSLSKARTYYVKAIRQYELKQTHLCLDVFTHFNQSKQKVVMQGRLDLVSQERIRLNRLQDELRQQFEVLRSAFEADSTRVKELERPLRTVAPPDVLPFAEALTGMIRSRPQIPSLVQHMLNFLSSKDPYMFYAAACSAAQYGSISSKTGNPQPLVYAANGVVSVLATAASASAAMQGGMAGSAAAANAAAVAAFTQMFSSAQAHSTNSRPIGKQKFARRASIGSSPYSVSFAEQQASISRAPGSGYDIFMDLLRTLPKEWSESARFMFGNPAASTGTLLNPLLYESSPSVPCAVNGPLSHNSVAVHASNSSTTSGTVNEESSGGDESTMPTSPVPGVNVQPVGHVTPLPFIPTASIVYQGLVLSGVAPASVAAAPIGAGPIEHNVVVDPMLATHGVSSIKQGAGDLMALNATSAGGSFSSLSPYPPASWSRPSLVGLAQELVLRFAGLVLIQACISSQANLFGASSGNPTVTSSGAGLAGSNIVSRGGSNNQIATAPSSTNAISYSPSSSIHSTIPPHLGRIALPIDSNGQPTLIRNAEPMRPSDLVSDEVWNWFMTRYRALCDLEKDQLRRSEELLSLMHSRFAVENASKVVAHELSLLERARSRLNSSIRQCECNASLLLLVNQGYVELSQSPLVPDYGASLLIPRDWIQNLNEQILSAGSGIEGILSAIVKLYSKTNLLDEEIERKDNLIRNMVATRTELQVKRYNKQQQQDIKRGIDLNRTREVQSLNSRIQHLRDSDNERERARHALHQKLQALAQQRRDENKRLEVIVQQLETAVRERMQISVIRADQLLGGNILSSQSPSKEASRPGSRSDSATAAIVALSDTTLIDRALKALDDDVVASTAANAYMASPFKRALSATRRSSVSRPATSASVSGAASIKGENVEGDSLSMVSGLLGLVKNSPGQIALNSVESKKMKDVTMRSKLVNLAKLQGEEVRFLREQVEILRRRTFASFTATSSGVTSTRPLTSPAIVTSLSRFESMANSGFVAPRITSFAPPPNTATPFTQSNTFAANAAGPLASQSNVNGARRSVSSAVPSSNRNQAASNVGRPATSFVSQDASSGLQRQAYRPSTRGGVASSGQDHSLPPIFGSNTSSNNNNSIGESMRARGFGFAESGKL